eukprot:1156585-Pelagomonas_calceolata.AAC.10
MDSTFTLTVEACAVVSASRVRLWGKVAQMRAPHQCLQWHSWMSRQQDWTQHPDLLCGRSVEGKTESNPKLQPGQKGRVEEEMMKVDARHYILDSKFRSQTASPCMTSTQAIRSARTRGTAIVLTTHSMAEAEALGDRLGIFVSGQMRALGSTQQLAARFSWEDSYKSHAIATRRMRCLQLPFHAR